MYLLLYVIYLLLSITIIFILDWKSRMKILLKVVVITFLPVVGWLLPMIWPRLYSPNSNNEFQEYVDKQHEEHKIRKIGVYNLVERKKELDIIPIEDALIVSEHKERRQVMIDVLKKDTINYIEILKTAISNEDTETSHYAVSAIIEMKRKLLMSLQELSVKYENAPTDLHVVSAYTEVLSEFMKSGFLDQRTLRKYQYTYLSVLVHLIGLSDDAEFGYREKINMEIQLELYMDAEQTGLLYIKNYPKSEDAYLSLIKIYFAMRSEQKLKMTIERLKKAPVRLSNHAITMVRFWSEGA